MSCLLAAGSGRRPCVSVYFSSPLLSLSSSLLSSLSVTRRQCRTGVWVQWNELRMAHIHVGAYGVLGVNVNGNRSTQNSTQWQVDTGTRRRGDTYTHTGGRSDNMVQRRVVPWRRARERNRETETGNVHTVHLPLLFSGTKHVQQRFSNAKGAHTRSARH